jgi:hypothetical protein
MHGLSNVPLFWPDVLKLKEKGYFCCQILRFFINDKQKIIAH